MHHSDQPLPSELLAAMKEGLGATGTFPLGKLTESDEGEIAFRVAHRSGKVILDLGPKPVAWIGLTPEQADALADILRQHAAASRR